MGNEIEIYRKRVSREIFGKFRIVGNNPSKKKIIA